MNAPIGLVTGANGGIGKAVAQHLAQAGLHVVMVCRSREKGEQAQREVMDGSGSQSVDLLLADLSSQQSIRQLAAQFQRKYSRLDVLVNNAAVYKPARSVTVDGLETMFATNHLAYFLLTTLLLDALRASAAARVLNVTAPATNQLDFDDLQGEKQFTALNRFGMSKMANLVFTLTLAQRLADSSVSVNAIHPGLVRSGIMREANPLIRLMSGLMSRAPEQAAKPIVQVATAPEYAGKTGRFYLRGKEIAINPYAQDVAVQQRLWAVSEALTQPAHAG